jgi:hypothetical protein
MFSSIFSGVKKLYDARCACAVPLLTRQVSVKSGHYYSIDTMVCGMALRQSLRGFIDSKTLQIHEQKADL